MRKKTVAPDQPSLFENPAGPTQAEFRLALIEEFKKSKADYYVEANKKRRKKSRLDSIRLGDDSDTPGQTSFAHITPVGSYPTGCFPPLGGAERVEAIIAGACSGDWIGLDFEFNPSNDRITIIGVANADEAAGCKFVPAYHEWLLRSAMDRGAKMVGHWVLGADKPVLEKRLGSSTPSSAWIDSMGLHFLCNQCLCKAPGKESDGEGSLGYMSLHHATCVNTDISAGYKSCVGIGCLGQIEGPSRIPCPQHFVTGYCAVDAYAGLISAINCREKMNRLSIPWRCYEEWHESTLGALCAESRGIRIDKPFIEAFDKQVEERKANLFRVPSAKRPKYEPFNPKSGKQVAEWFKARRVHLVDSVGKASTDKKIVLAALEQEIKKYGFVDIEEFEKNADSITLSDVDAALYKLFLYKDSGKGMKPWFDEDKHLRHHDGAWWVHPRFNTTGASTTRFSSSSPNFQNIPSRGWGLAIKRAIIPRDEDSCILCSDASQLEYRIILYECGETPPPGDFFKWLLARADGNFARAAERMHGIERDIAKQTAHSSNYGSGFKLLDDWQLSNSQVLKQEREGALRIFRDWRMGGKTVAFTGANLAQNLFGDKTFESRKKALDLQFDVFFKAAPFVHQLHRRLSQQIETGVVTLRTGHRLELLEDHQENFKAGTAFVGQGGGAQYVQAKMRDANRRDASRPWAAQIHDEILWDSVPRSWSAEQKLDFVRFLWEEETPQFPGLLIPWKTKTGPSWGEAKEITL